MILETHSAAFSRAKIELRNVGKAFRDGRGHRWAIRDVSLACESGQFVAVVGPSGCGKSTVLHLIAGLHRETVGEVLYEGHALDGVNTEIGYVTQRDNLLPWRTVSGNIGLGLELNHVKRADRRRRVDDMINRVGLDGFANHYPHQLSGGMRKRVTLARTLVFARDTWLMDEPFAALDTQLKLILQEELLRLWEESRTTVIYVTHDIAEAIALSDIVVVFGGRPGRIIRVVQNHLPRPRDVLALQSEPEYQRLHLELWTLLKPEAAASESAR